VSVVIPVHGEQPFLDEQLAALSGQTYPGWWEVLVADNGCTPDTLATAQEWVGQIRRLRVVDARSRPGANYARNEGVSCAEGDLIAICDSDDVVEPDWIDALVRAAADAELVGGHLDVSRLNSTLVQAWRPSPTEGGLPQGLDFLPYVAGSNCALWKDVYQAVGGCEEEGVGGGGGDDVDLSWRVQLAGGRVAFAADAVVHYRLRSDMRTMVRQMVAYGVSSALLYRRFREHGARRSPLGITIKHWIRTVVRAPRMLRYPASRGSWIREVAFMVGRIRGAWRHRVIYW
jgi:glycosyltransferase involved in cell wall biosynthesis